MLNKNDHRDKEERAARLQFARKAAGFSSGIKAATRFHWNENSYKAHEAGRNSFGIAQARDYARAFGVNLIWLLTGEGAHSDETPNITAEEAEDAIVKSVQNALAIGLAGRQITGLVMDVILDAKSDKLVRHLGYEDSPSADVSGEVKSSGQKRNRRYESS